MDNYLFGERGDRISWCQDRRAHFRVPARVFRAFTRTLWLVITCSKSNILLPIVPFAIIASRGQWSQTLAFFLSYLALVPAIGLFRYGNELFSVAVASNLRWLWDATAGTLSLDLEVVILALARGELKLVKTYIAGKVAASCLLTLGCCFLAATLRRQERPFHLKTATTLLSLLFIAVVAHTMAATLVAALTRSFADSDSNVLLYSRGTSLILVEIYVIFAFSRGTIFNDVFDASYEESQTASGTSTGRRLSNRSQGPGLLTATIMIILAIGITYECSSALIGGLSSAGIQSSFVGFCLLPLLFELAEAPRVVRMAYDDRMSAALEIAVATGVQTAAFVSPGLCVLGWIIHQPYNLDLGMFTTIILMLTSWLFGLLTVMGTGFWFSGCACYAIYCIMCLGFYLYPEDTGDIGDYMRKASGLQYE